MNSFFAWDFKKFMFELKTKVLRPKIYKSYKESKDDLYSYEIDKLNLARRREIVSHAFENSEFYQEKYKDFEGNLSYIDENDFLKLPPVTREDLAGNFDKFATRQRTFRKYKKVTSSGSTGKPVSVLQDPDFPYTTLQWRILGWWGVEPYENQAFIYRYKRPKLSSWANDLLWWPTKRAFLPGAEMNLEKAKNFVDDVNRIQPALLQGYVDVVYEFALLVLDHELKIHSPKMVWVTSAPLLDNQRKIMEEAFGAPVCDQYGNTEVFTIAAECPKQKGLHIMHDAVHIEFVDNNNDPVLAGTTGKILITDLRNRLFPLIRYEIGDRGKLSESGDDCNIPLPLMDNVRGRQSITLQTPSGLTVRSEHLAMMFEKNVRKIREVQLVQKNDYSVELNYVANSNGIVKDEVELLLGELRTRTRNELTIDAKPVERLTMKGSKKPLIISGLDGNLLSFSD